MKRTYIFSYVTPGNEHKVIFSADGDEEALEECERIMEFHLRCGEPVEDEGLEVVEDYDIHKRPLFRKVRPPGGISNPD